MCYGRAGCGGYNWRLSRTLCNRAQYRRNLALAGHKIVIGLKAKKESFRHPEIAREAQIRVRSDGTLAEHDLVNPAWRYMNRASERILTQPHRFQELFQKNFPRSRVR